MKKKFSDLGDLNVFRYSNGDELRLNITDRANHTDYITLPTNIVTFWAGRVENGVVCLTRLEGDKLVNKTLKECRTTDAAIHTATREIGIDGGTQLFLGYQTKARVEFIPISAACKMSITNRSKVSIAGELNEDDFGISPIALAKVYEDSVKKYAENIRCAVVYGKVIGIMSEIFSPIPQDELVDTVLRVLHERHANAEVISGSISNRITSVDFDLKETIVENGLQVEILTTLLNSDNGYSAVRLVPCCRFAGKSTVYPFHDDGWASNHVSLDMEAIAEGVDTMFMNLRDTVSLLANAQTRVLQYPYVYTEKVIEQLNRWATNKGGAKITKHAAKDILCRVDTLVSQNIISEFTVMDIADYLMDAIPQDAAMTTQDAWRKTVMRIIHVDHDAIDVV